MSSTSRLFVCLGSCLALLWPAGPAGAQPDAADTPARRALVTRAKNAHEAGQHAQALQLAQQALELKTTPQLLFFVAQEQREAGAPADAFVTAGRCAQAAHAESGGRSADVERLCQDMTAGLLRQVGQLVVRVPEATPGLVVRLGGRALQDGMFGVPLVLSPGAQAIEAAAPDHASLRWDVALAAGALMEIVVKLPPAGAPAPAVAAAPVLPATPSPAPALQTAALVGAGGPGTAAGLAPAGGLPVAGAGPAARWSYPPGPSAAPATAPPTLTADAASVDPELPEIGMLSLGVLVGGFAALDRPAGTGTVTMMLGGDGMAFRLDLDVSGGDHDFYTLGGGIYPLNYTTSSLGRRSLWSFGAGMIGGGGELKHDRPTKEGNWTEAFPYLGGRLVVDWKRRWSPSFALVVESGLAVVATAKRGKDMVPSFDLKVGVSWL
jgi:hypothetical protein